MSHVILELSARLVRLGRRPSSDAGARIPAFAVKRRPCGVAGLIALLATPFLPAADFDYRLEVIAFSPDYPADPTVSSRSFSPPKLNAAGQVLFSANWFKSYPQAKLYLGRPGSVATIATAGDSAPGVAGMIFKGGPNTGVSASVGFGYDSVNGAGQVFFLAPTDDTNPALPPPFTSAVYRGSAGGLSHVAAAPLNETSPGSTPPSNISGVPYNGSGRLQFSYDDGFKFHEPRPWIITDDGRAYYYANLDALEGNTIVPVATECLIESGPAGSKLVCYKGAPAPGVPGNLVFESLDLVSSSFGQKTGNAAFRATLRPPGSTDPQTFKTVFYQYVSGFLDPFYIDGDPIFGASNLMQVSAWSEAVRIDASGNAVLEVDALDSNGGVRKRVIWKKGPNGLTRVATFGEDQAVEGGTVRLIEPISGPNLHRIAMGGGRVAFIGRFTGLGQASSTAGVFRESPTGMQALAWTGLTLPGSTVSFSFDFATLPPLLMNENGDVAFPASFFDSGVTRRALWCIDRNRGIHRVVYIGQTIAVNGVNRTVSNFLLPIEAGVPPPLPQMFNDAGQLVFTAIFSDGTRAILRGSPVGHVDPPLRGEDFYFTGLKGDNWHTRGGTPPTNWESSARDPRADPPGDAEVDTAQVFIPAGKSVILDARPAFVGSIDAAGDLTLQQHLRVSLASTLGSLRVFGPNAALTLGATTTISGITDWSSGTLTLANSELRNQGTFSLGGGTISGSGASGRFVTQGRLIKGTGLATFSAPLVVTSANPPNTKTTVEINSGAALRLQGGGRFETYTQVQFAGAASTLGMSGDFDLAGHTLLELVRDGNVEFGSATRDIRLRLADSAVVNLGDDLQPAPTTRFFRGEISGLQGSVYAYGDFTWHGGRIAVGTPTIVPFGPLYGFFPDRRFTIESDAVPREVDGRLGCVDTVQRGGFDLKGTAVNHRHWSIERPLTISASGGTGLFENLGTLVVESAVNGTVEIACGFTNADGIALQSRVGRVTVESGSTGKNILRFRGPVSNIGRNEVFKGGIWTVKGGSTLNLPALISEIAPGTALFLLGGDMPELLFYKNLGAVTFGQKAYQTPSALENRGAITITENGRLTVDGNLENHGTLTCTQNATLHVDGTLFMRGGTLANNGTIEVTGDIRSDAFRISGSGRYVLPRGTFVFQNGVLVPANSPGTLTIDGAALLAAAASTELEIAGTAAGQSDLIVVTKTFTLGGNLLVTLLDDFRPTAAQTFTVVQAASIAGAFANVASGQRVATTDGSGSFMVTYGAGSPFNPGQVVLSNWQPAAAGAPIITAQAKTETIGAGGPTTLSVAVSGTGPFTYRWQFQGLDIPGATGASYLIPSVQVTDAGNYAVTVSSPLGTVRSAIATLSVDPPAPNGARLLNLSTRALAQSGDNILIPGFVVGGSGTKRLLIRGIGPTLTTYGVTGALPNPAMQLLRGTTVVAANDDWGSPQPGVTSQTLAATAAAAGAFPLGNGSRDAVLLVDLPPGAYTVPTSDVAGGSGVAIIEVYDVDAPGATASLQNISTRGFVGAGEFIMIPGIVVSSDGPRTLLIRAVGPTLSQFGVDGTLADPVLTVFRDGNRILANDDWSTAPGADATAAAAVQVGAFPLPGGSRDAAFVVTLPPGSYTAQVAGKNETTGVALVEVYLLP